MFSYVECNTYDGSLLLFDFVQMISYHNWFVYIELYYQQLFTIIAYHLNAHIMLLRYVICYYIWYMANQNYELLTHMFQKLANQINWTLWLAKWIIDDLCLVSVVFITKKPLYSMSRACYSRALEDIRSKNVVLKWTWKPGNIHIRKEQHCSLN